MGIEVPTVKIRLIKEIKENLLCSVLTSVGRTDFQDTGAQVALALMFQQLYEKKSQPNLWRIIVSGDLNTLYVHPLAMGYVSKMVQHYVRYHHRPITIKNNHACYQQISKALADLDFQISVQNDETIFVKQTIIVMIGRSGSGKTTLANTLATALTRFEILHQDEIGTSKETEEQVKICMNEGNSCIVDRTNLTKEVRKRVLTLKTDKCQAIALVVGADLSVEALNQRVSNRNQKPVPPAVAINSQTSQFENPEKSEGFDKILYVTDGNTGGIVQYLKDRVGGGPGDSPGAGGTGNSKSTGNSNDDNDGTGNSKSTGTSKSTGNSNASESTGDSTATAKHCPKNQLLDSRGTALPNGVTYLKDFLPQETLESVTKAVRELENQKTAYLAGGMFAKPPSTRQNVPKIVFTFFYDKHGNVMKKGTNGTRSVYDWQQEVETYVLALNIHEYPEMLQLLLDVNARDGTAYNNLYVIFYRGILNFINRHKDKKHTFMKDASILLLNLLLEGTARTFEVTNKNKKVVASFTMKNNEAVVLSWIANTENYHSLVKCDKEEEMLRASVTFREINDKIQVRPAKLRTVEYGDGLTPKEGQVKKLGIEVLDKRKKNATWVHACEIIKKREINTKYFQELYAARDTGNINEVKSLLESKHGKSKGKWHRVYNSFLTKVMAAESIEAAAKVMDDWEDKNKRRHTKTTKDTDANFKTKWDNFKTRKLKEWQDVKDGKAVDHSSGDNEFGETEFSEETEFCETLDATENPVTRGLATLSVSTGTEKSDDTGKSEKTESSSGKDSEETGKSEETDIPVTESSATTELCNTNFGAFVPTSANTEGNNQCSPNVCGHVSGLEKNALFGEVLQPESVDEALLGQYIRKTNIELERMIANPDCKEFKVYCEEQKSRDDIDVTKEQVEDRLNECRGKIVGNNNTLEAMRQLSLTGDFNGEVEMFAAMGFNSFSDFIPWVRKKAGFQELKFVTVSTLTYEQLTSAEITSQEIIECLREAQHFGIRNTEANQKNVEELLKHLKNKTLVLIANSGAHWYDVRPKGLEYHTPAAPDFKYTWKETNTLGRWKVNWKSKLESYYGESIDADKFDKVLIGYEKLQSQRTVFFCCFLKRVDEEMYEMHQFKCEHDHQYKDEMLGIMVSKHPCLTVQNPVSNTCEFLKKHAFKQTGNCYTRSSGTSSEPSGESKQAETEQSGWVIPGRMHVQHNSGIDAKLQKKCGVSLEQVQKKINELPDSQWKKNSRNKNNRGQLQIGVSTYAGSQSTSVGGKNMWYTLNSTKYLKEHEPKLWEYIVNIAELCWPDFQKRFPQRAANMMLLPQEVRIGNTGFQKGSIGTNLAAWWHYDEKNMIEGAQCVLVMGQHTGAKVSFDPQGRKNRMNTANNPSKGDENNVIKVQTYNDTLCCGLYGQDWHKVDKVESGNRTIAAFFSHEAICKSVEACNACNLSAAAATELKDARIVELDTIKKNNKIPNESKSSKVVSPDGVKLVVAKKREWRREDLEAQYGNPLSPEGQTELKDIQRDWELVDIKAANTEDGNLTPEGKNLLKQKRQQYKAEDNNVNRELHFNTVPREDVPQAVPQENDTEKMEGHRVYYNQGGNELYNYGRNEHDPGKLAKKKEGKTMHLGWVNEIHNVEHNFVAEVVKISGSDQRRKPCKLPTSMEEQKKLYQDSKWYNLRLVVFDCPTHPGTYEERYAYLQEQSKTWPHFMELVADKI